jgi:hypothetical protein
MRISEILNESGEGSLQSDVARALPAAFVLPGLPNQDPYYQYRMGMAVARARAEQQGLLPKANVEGSTFGENMLISTQCPEDEETIRLALKMMPGKSSSRQISTNKSQESETVNKVSPVCKFVKKGPR